MIKILKADKLIFKLSKQLRAYYDKDYLIQKQIRIFDSVKLFKQQIYKYTKVKQQFLSTQQLSELKQTNGKTIQCKAAVAWNNNQQFDVTDIEVEPPKKGELRIKILSSAISPSDIKTLKDPDTKFPCILGHEAICIVESVGEGVQDYNIGDLIIPCFVPECQKIDCFACSYEKTNFCYQIFSTQIEGLMPDGSSRFSKDGKKIFHNMGCSTLSEYSVISSISAIRIDPLCDVKEIMLLGCGVSTGWGVVLNTCKVQPFQSVVVFGLGTVGLAVIQAAKQAGAYPIIGVDINSKNFSLARKFGASNCLNLNKIDSIQKHLLTGDYALGYDFTFDCTGDIKSMEIAFDVAHQFWGQSCVVGVSKHQVQTKSYQLNSGKIWKGTIFGGWKSRSQIPTLVKQVMRNEFTIDDYVTHRIKGLENINESLSDINLRTIIKISDFNQKKINYQQVSKVKVQNGYIHRINHWSFYNNCQMSFSVFVPAKLDNKIPPVLYFLSGLKCSDEETRTQSAFQEYASKHQIVVVFPDTSGRGLDIEKDQDDMLGEGAGFYVNATSAKYKKYFQNYDYVVYELPQLVDSLFTIDNSRMSIMGHSMGGHGALSIFLKNPGMFKSVSALAPNCNPTKSPWGQKLFKEYLGSVEAGIQYDSTELLKTYQGPRIPILIDQGTKDKYLNDLLPQSIEKIAKQVGYPLMMRMQPGYNHGYFFVSTFIKDHIEFHSKYLHQ